MKVTFLGGTGTVTGSKYLVRDETTSVLVDCGLFQGLKELRLRNWAPFPVPPNTIDAVVLTHAHLDHSGYLPRLAREGFSGPIYCSEATAALAGILLPDSGHLQEEDAERANRHGYTKHKPALPLYTEDEARACLKLLRPVPFARRQELSDFLGFSLHHAGHIPGAASVLLDDGSSSILFSGDLGRANDPVMRPPVPPPGADVLVVESTYGDRLHDKADPAESLAEIILRTIRRGGTVVVPAFAVGRAQLVLYYLHRLKQEGRLPRDLPIYLDSPMAIDVADLLGRFPAEHRLGRDLCAAVCATARYVRTRAESQALDADPRAPSVIVSASGMATGGRVLHHLARYLGDARNAVVLAGFQAAGTRGDRLARGETEIKIHGRMIPVQAEIHQLPGLSAHADADELLDWMSGMPSAPRQVLVTHGETAVSAALSGAIADRLGWPARPAIDGEVFEV